MKRRSGFVSNSSSSSFIVGFKNIPITRGELLDMMFPNGEMVVRAPWDGEDGDALSVLTIVEEVMDDIGNKNFIPATTSEIEDALDCGLMMEDSVGFDVVEPNYRNSTEQFLEEKEREAKKALNKIEEVYPDLKFFIFKYEDKGPLAVMEHGNIFENMIHIHMSNH